MEKVNKPVTISLEKDVNEGATVVANFKKSTYAVNVASIQSENPSRKENALFNSDLREEFLPDLERITHSLRKVQEIMVAAHLLWPNKNTARKITADTVKIINQVYKRKFSFCNGKSLRCIVGGLFYLLSFRYDDPKKQREIALALQITDVSIRTFYKKWLNEFPELFEDIMAKENYQVLR